MKEVKIYGLICPKTKEIKYVGKTIQPLKQRLKGHLSVTDNDLTYRANWIRNLKKENLKPEIILLETCDDNNWEEREMYWINYYSKLVTLTNYTKGGNGGHITKISTKLKLSETYKEKWKDENYRKKMNQIIKDFWADNKNKIERSNIFKEKWKDEEYRKKMSEISKLAWAKNRKCRLTEESREKLRNSKLNSSLSENTKNKIGKKSKELWDINKEKWTKTRFKKPVIINNVEYDSVKSAAIFFNVHSSVISKKINSDKYPNYKKKGI